ncbi:MAG: SH3 domain-containing protein [Chloroflexota bacterium]
MLVALVVVGIVGLGLLSQTVDLTLPRSLTGSLQRPTPSRPTDGAAPVPKAQVASADPAAAGSATTPAQALAVGSRARVANTDGQGVVLYSAPRQNARQPAGLLEGTTVTVLEVSGNEWARVQSDTKKTGWVKTAYLVGAE